jgi:DNA-binding MarR family transcriptional regulator
MGISPAAVTTSLKKLEKEEYVTRAATDEDNRRNEIHITEKGIAKINENHGIFEALDRSMFEGFSEEELATLISLMNRIDKNLDAVGAPANPPLSVNNSRTRKEV